MTIAFPDEPIGNALRRHLRSVDRVVAHTVSVGHELRPLPRAVAEGLDLGVVEFWTSVAKPLTLRP